MTVGEPRSFDESSCTQQRADTPPGARTGRAVSDAVGGANGHSKELFVQLYPRLRELAQSHFRQESPGSTLQPTALVHEVYLRIASKGELRADDERYFFAAASRAMRRILVEQARRRRGPTRRPKGRRVSLSTAEELLHHTDVDVLVIDEALSELSERHERAGRVVELRFFGGLTLDETADVLGVSPRTVDVDWRFARAWLLGRFDGEHA